MSSNHYDAIVIGVGSMGAATCWYLAKRGYHVLGLEQFDISHERGSHAGQSRIIRKAYYEHSDYVPLLERAYHNWSELESATASKVYYKTGLLYFGSPEAGILKGTREAAHKYNIHLHLLSETAGSTNYPSLNTPPHFQLLFEPDAGFITPEKAICLYVSDAISRGAVIKAREKVLNWKKEGNSVTVTTTRNVYHADRVIICAGPWSRKVIPSLPARLQVTRQVLGWVSPANWDDFSIGNFPCWILHDDDGSMYYGFPLLPPKDFGGPVGLKVAWHKEGLEVDPDVVDRSIDREEEEKLINILRKYLPGAAGDILTMKSCLYTNSEDNNFVIDHLPGYDGIVTIASGFSGHGFKFASAIGEILFDLAIEGKTNLPADFLKLDRFPRNESLK